MRRPLFTLEDLGVEETPLWRAVMSMQGDATSDEAATEDFEQTFAMPLDEISSAAMLIAMVCSGQLLDREKVAVLARYVRVGLLVGAKSQLPTERIIEREECSACGAEVQGQHWRCDHQEQTPTIVRRYVQLADGDPSDPRSG